LLYYRNPFFILIGKLKSSVKVFPRKPLIR